MLKSKWREIAEDEERIGDGERREEIKGREERKMRFLSFFLTF